MKKILKNEKCNQFCKKKSFFDLNLTKIEYIFVLAIREVF